MHNLLCAALLLATPAFAGNVFLTHQGRALDSLGSAIDGTVDITVTLYDAATDGNELWSKEFTATPVQHGYFDVELNGVDDSARELDIAGGTAGGPVWLGVTLGDDPELGPRKRIAAYVWFGALLNDGSSASAAATSCQQLHTDFPAKTSGSYWLDPDGATPTISPFFGYCQMNAEGGWTLVLRGGTGVPTSGQWFSSGGYNVDPDAASGTQAGPTFKLADSVINAFSGVYRTETSGTYVHTRYSPGTCSYGHTTAVSGDCATTCDDVDLTTGCQTGSGNDYNRGLGGGMSNTNGCGVQYFATCTHSGYMGGPSSSYNMYWVVQQATGGNNSTCAYGPGQKWLDNSNVNANSTITVWRR